MRARRKQSGFTLFELVLVISLVSILAGIAFERLAYYQEVAEMAAAESNLSILKSALHIRSGELVSANRWDELQRLAQQNPFDLLEEKPATYGGRFSTGVPAGKWYFDDSAKAVVYRAARVDGLQTGDGGSDMRFSVVGWNTAGQKVTGSGVAYVSLRATGSYRWLDRVFR